MPESTPDWHRIIRGAARKVLKRNRLRDGYEDLVQAGELGLHIALERGVEPWPRICDEFDNCLASLRIIAITQRTLRRTKGKALEQMPRRRPLGQTPCTYDVDDSEIREFIVKLPPDQRQILELRLEGYDDTEIGEILGKHRSTIWLIRKSIGERYEARREDEGMG